MIAALGILALGFLLVVVQSALGAVLDLGLLMPNPVLPIVLYLGMTPDISLARGSALSFALGLLLDSAAGQSMGLFTFVHQATFLVTRGASLRLFMRGQLSQMLLAAAASLAGSATIVALRGIFRPAGHFEAVSALHLAAAVLLSGLSTGLIAPFIFQLVRRIDQLRRREDGAAMR